MMDTPTNNKCFLPQYLAFKQQLLYALADRDPLQVLQDGIFQKFENKVFGSISVHDDGGYGRYETRIQTMQIEQDLKIEVVERRARSCEKERDGKILKLQQRNKVDLLIWSNIMNNHFRNQQIREIKLPILPSNIKVQSPITQCNNTQSDKENINTTNINTNLKHMEQNEELKQKLKQKSYRQLQFFVKEKQFTKRIQEMEKQITNAQYIIAQLKERQKLMDQAMLGKIRELQNKDKRKIIFKKNTIQDFKEKLQIQSMRRNTLLGLQRKDIQITLKQQQLGLFEQESDQSEEEDDECMEQTMPNSLT